MRIFEKLKSVGPAAVITGSFIGPGTITTATRTGAEFGYSLLWTIVFAIIATIVLQEMAARLGVVTRKGLSEAITELFTHPVLRIPSMIMVAIAIPLGCLAYMGGDLTGASLGLSAVTGLPSNVVGPIIGCAILALIYWGPIRLIEKVLIALVAIMAFVFIVTMMITKPDLSEVAQGLIPSIPSGGILLAIGLIGTTIVPYNLFVHSANAAMRFNSENAIKESRFDIAISIGVGGLITASVLICAGTLMHGTEVNSIADLALAVQPLLGDFAKPFISLGLIAAGVSSAIVTPLGASYVLAGLFGWRYDKTDKRFLASNVIVLLFGILISATGFDPITLIILAQVLNGLVLPIAVIFLVIICSQKRFLHTRVNTSLQNLLGVLISLICLYLGYAAIVS